MVETEVVIIEPATTILAAILIAQKDITATEFHQIVREAIVSQQANDARNLNREVDGPHPVFVVIDLTNLDSQFADFQPGGEIVSEVRAVLDTDDFGHPLPEHGERTACGNGLNGDVRAVQSENVRLQRDTWAGHDTAPAFPLDGIHPNRFVRFPQAAPNWSSLNGFYLMRQNSGRQVFNPGTLVPECIPHSEFLTQRRKVAEDRKENKIQENEYVKPKDNTRSFLRVDRNSSLLLPRFLEIIICRPDGPCLSRGS